MAWIFSTKMTNTGILNGKANLTLNNSALTIKKDPD